MRNVVTICKIFSLSVLLCCVQCRCFVGRNDVYLSPVIFKKQPLLAASNDLYILDIGKKPAACDQNGKIVIPPIYDSISPSGSGLYVVKSNGKYGCLNDRYEIIMPFLYDSLDFSMSNNGIGVFKQKGKSGLINLKGEIVLKPELDAIKPIGKGLFAYKENGNWGCLDSQGNIIVMPKYSKINKVKDDFIPATIIIDGKPKMTMLNLKGEIVIPPEFDSIRPFSEGLALVTTHSKYRGRPKRSCGFINKEGRVVIELKFDDACSFSEGLAVVNDTRTNKFGFIDRKGDYVIQPTFTLAYSFSQGLAIVANKHMRWGLINKEGEYVVKPTFDWVFNADAGFVDGKLRVSHDGKTFAIDKTGKKVTFITLPQRIKSNQERLGIKPEMIYSEEELKKLFKTD